MWCLPWGLQIPDLINWLVALIVGLTGAYLGARLVLKSEKRKEMETKRREVRELQPRMSVEARWEHHPTYSIVVRIINRGSEAKNIEITMDGSISKAQLKELGVNYHPPRDTVPRELHLHISPQQEIFQKKFENPKLYIKYHDKWFLGAEYLITVPFLQKKFGGDGFKYKADFEGSKQDPPWEQTAYSGYTDKQILEIWNRENLGRK